MSACDPWAQRRLGPTPTGFGAPCRFEDQSGCSTTVSDQSARRPGVEPGQRRYRPRHLRGSVAGIATPGIGHPRRARCGARRHYEELTMQTKFDKPIEVSHGKKFADMTRAQNIVFVAKVVASVATFGFAFPNVQND